VNVREHKTLQGKFWLHRGTDSNAAHELLPPGKQRFEKGYSPLKLYRYPNALDAQRDQGESTTHILSWLFATFNHYVCHLDQ